MQRLSTQQDTTGERLSQISPEKSPAFRHVFAYYYFLDEIGYLWGGDIMASIPDFQEAQAYDDMHVQYLKMVTKDGLRV